MNKYRRVADKKAKILPNEIRVTADKNVYKYVKYGKQILDGNEYKYIVIQGFGRGIKNAILVSEMLKRSVSMLHSNVNTGSCILCNTYEPLEEGLDNICVYKKVCYASIKLSKDVNALLEDKDNENEELNEAEDNDQCAKIKHVGYSPPIETHPVKDLIEIQPMSSRRIINVEKRRKMLEKKKAKKRSNRRKRMAERSKRVSVSEMKGNDEKEASAKDEEGREKCDKEKIEEHGTEEKVGKGEVEIAEKKKRRRKKKAVSSNVSTAVSPLNNRNYNSTRRVQRKPKININENLNKLNEYNKNNENENSGDPSKEKRHSKRRAANKRRWKNSVAPSSLTIISSSSTTAVSSPSPSSAYSSSLGSNVIPLNNAHTNVSSNDGGNNYSSNTDKKYVSENSMNAQKKKKKKKSLFASEMKHYRRNRQQVDGHERARSKKSMEKQENQSIGKGGEGGGGEGGGGGGGGEEGRRGGGRRGGGKGGGRRGRRGRRGGGEGGGKGEEGGKGGEDKNLMPRSHLLEAEVNPKQKVNQGVGAATNFRAAAAKEVRSKAFPRIKPKQNSEFVFKHVNNCVGNQMLKVHARKMRYFGDPRRFHKESSKITFGFKPIAMKTVTPPDSDTQKRNRSISQENEITNNVNANNQNSVITH